MDQMSCANPLFVKWLSEWKEEAANKGLKSAHTYNRAISSLKKYPLPLATGKDCKILENFGDKICRQLDERLAAYSADRADVATVWEDVTHAPIAHTRPSVCVGANGNPQHARGRRRHVSELIGGSHPYVPQYRSGAYALLLTLYNNKQKADSHGFMTKQELMRDAQPLADKSFKRPDPGSQYTAWSSMGTLVVKGHIIRTCCPAKYIITESGCELAVQLLQANQDISPTCRESNCRLVQPQVTRASEADEVMIIEDIPLMQRLGQKHRPTSKNGISTSTNTRVAEAICEYSTNGGTATANELLAERIGALCTTSRTASNKTLATSMNGTRKLAASSRGGNTVDRTASTVSDKRSQKRPHVEDAGGDDDTASSNAKTSLTVDKMKWIIHGTSSDTATRTEDNAGRNQQEALWEMAAYSYDVVLCVDNCELYGRDREGRDVLLRELEKNNVTFVVRKLQVGDFLWVAKGNTGRHKGEELMLEYIVERKRMDDLAGSIIDGRFHEQKFRLWNSGVKNVIYLIEKYGSNQHLSIAEDSLNQAIINTQVIDKFHIKHTASTRESAAYLTLMTRHLQSFYAGKTLACGATNKHGQFVTFQDFNDSTVKTKAMTVTEMFAKQLLQLHGMTGEKALAITQAFPTPASLLEAYNSGRSKKQKEELLAALRCGPLNRPLGAPLSKLLYMLYSTETALR